ncbi:hypothetical protein CAEBREN_06263 [Caenorhabditis brenneri]|uniref:Receptor L-domain domain-containing protein n=1 Tax=Caenorhabditis brenneri TaxID=135651 RepID=G0N3S7_CAEBE|nr:hypothetical protein CAEBREN_06263 [Caenorhabditis brenneri]
MHPELSSKTIEFFPKCEEVCGLLVFNSNTDLSEIQLKDVFMNMKKLIGGVRVENSNLTNLSFFTVPEGKKYMDFDCLPYGVQIRNNPKLTDVTMLWKLYYWLDFDKRECDIRIENNPILNVENLCYYGYLYIFINIRTEGNLKNCGCRGSDFPSEKENLEQIRDCKLILNGLRLENVAEAENIPWNATEIRGEIVARNSSFEDLSFLKNLGTLKVSNPSIRERIMVDIRDNKEMRRWGLAKLKEFPNIWNGYLFVNFENLHPDFCLTIEELIIFLKSNVIFVNLHAKYCQGYGDLKGSKMCAFGNMSSLEKNCEYILGNVEIGPGDEKYVSKLESVTIIFGTLKIENTTLKDLSFLGLLSYMTSLEDFSPIIQIVSNKNMKEAYLPSMLNIITKGENYAIIHNNHPSLVSYDGFELYHSIWTSRPVYFGGILGCPSDKFSVLGPKFFESCSILTRGLQLTNSSFSQDLYSFSNIKTINGAIEISNTNLQNLSFLENVKTIQDEEFMGNGGIRINIHHNPEMRRLGLKALKNIFFLNSNTINLEQLHPDFCLTISEMIAFLDPSIQFLNIDAKFCDDIDDEQVCKFENISSLKTGCVYILGDVKVENGDEDFVEKLKSVLIIFGSLRIQNTQLSDLRFLTNLKKMANLNCK